ncbi:MAG TPA: hypothetical protein VLM79_28900 [Kofleriaceae bacterium]|nr:hypothetical protein [Kofleriaceae bacterium]
MGVLRVIAVALVACSAAGADPAAAPSSVAHPEGWKQLPAVAAAVGAAAKADGVTIDSVDAWGEPAHGCYAVWLELHGGSADAPALADQVLAGIARAAGPRDGAATVAAATTRSATKSSAATTSSAASWSEAVAVSNVVKPTAASGTLTLAFTSLPYRGRMRAQLGKGRIAAVACFANEREPLACQATCAPLLEAR